MAQTLVHVAGFHGGGTSWELHQGYTVLVEGKITDTNMSHHPAIDTHHLIDRTGEVLAQLVDQLPHHQALFSPDVAELLLDAVSVVQTSRPELDPTALVHDVRIIERLASRWNKRWQDHLKQVNAIDHARNHITNAIFNSVEQAVRDYDLRTRQDLPDGRQLITYEEGRPIYHTEIALAWLPELAKTLPAHHAKSRKLRHVAQRTASTSELSAWVDELVSENTTNINRLARYRNSLAHGGPSTHDIAVTAAPFAHQQAIRSTGNALWDALNGNDLATAFQTRAEYDQTWRRNVSAHTSVADTLWDAGERGAEHDRPSNRDWK